MNFGKAFSFQFQDESWISKILIPGLISLIPIIGQLYLFGWSLAHTKLVIAGDEDHLPETSFGEYLVLGLKGMVVGLVWSLPIYIFIAPIGIVSAMVDPNTSEGGMLLAVISLCCGSLMILWGVLIGLLAPAAYGNMIAKGESIGAGLRFGEIFGLFRANPGAYLMVLLGGLAAGFIGSLGSIACGVGVIFTIPYSMSINGHLMGQAYRAAQINRAY